MRKSLLIALTLTAKSVVFASSSASFTGGPGDGSAHADLIAQPQTSLPLHFLGGSRGGYASSLYIAYQPANAPALDRFQGNVRDGYASSIWRGYQPVVTSSLARFAGAIRDGYSSSRMLSTWSQTQPRRFLGGSFDGYDRQAVYGLPNWLLTDTDGNGLPDWWELQYFGVLTGTDPNGDPDHDGASNLLEYLSGTNPTNAVSCFHITRLALGSPKKIFVYCEPGNYYTLQRANGLGTGWTNVPNEIRISPPAEGVLEMDDSLGGPSSFYRVLLEH
jgi:hypothetical protein